MKEDLNKPLYADCKKQKGYKYFWNDPVISRERSYEFADRPLMIIGWLLIIIPAGIIGYLNPFWCRYIRFFEVPMICLVIIIIAEFFYTRKFVYRFGRFRVMWENDELHPNEEASSRCDRNGKFLGAEENRKAARKSRLAFLGLFAGIIAAVLLYCFLWIGLSYTRVPGWHSKEIEEAWQITQKYDFVGVHVLCRGADVSGETESGKDISDQDRRRIREICGSLKWEYVSDIMFYGPGTFIKIDMYTIFGHSKLLWHEDIVDTSPPEFSHADTIIRLDEHWWYVRMNDGSFFN